MKSTNYKVQRTNLAAKVRQIGESDKFTQKEPECQSNHSEICISAQRKEVNSGKILSHIGTAASDFNCNNIEIAPIPYHFTPELHKKLIFLSLFASV